MSVLNRGRIIGLIVVVGGLWVSGSQMPEEYLFEQQATLDWPPQQVYTLLTSPAQYEAWRHELWTVDVIDTNNVIEIGRLGLERPFTIQSERPPYQFSILDSDPNRMIARQRQYTLQPRDGGQHTMLTVTAQTIIRPAPLRPIMRYIVGLGWDIDRIIEDMQEHIAVQ